MIICTSIDIEIFFNTGKPVYRKILAYYKIPENPSILVHISTSAHFKKHSNFVSVHYFGFQTSEAGKPITQL